VTSQDRNLFPTHLAIPRDLRFRQKNPKFPRYIWPDFLQYLCERKSKKEKQQKPKQKEKQ
jgi:hypothetical protein